MRKLAALTFLTLDGVMQSPTSPEEDPSNNFNQGGWANDFWEEMMPLVMREAMSQPYDILFGRKTYDIFASHWPHVNSDNPLASIMNKSKKYVVTKTAKKLSWENSINICGDLKKEVLHLKKQKGPILQIHGSSQLIQSLLKFNLIDEFRMWIFPVVVGKGKRLFDENITLSRFKLVKISSSLNGVIMSIYQTKQ